MLHGLPNILRLLSGLILVEESIVCIAGVSRVPLIGVSLVAITGKSATTGASSKSATGSVTTPILSVVGGSREGRRHLSRTPEVLHCVRRQGRNVFTELTK